MTTRANGISAVPEAVASSRAGAEAMATESGVAAGWLHGRWADLAILLGPWLFLIVALGISTEAALAVWIAQFILGNTTHVILTFAMLGTRRDVLRATPSQPRLVIAGSLVTFAVTFGILVSVTELVPHWTTFPLAVVMIFGIQHRLAQARGIWSLYNLRAATLGTPAPPARERWFQQHWTSIGLLLVAVSWLLVPSAPDKSFSLAQAIPLQEALLPYETSYALVGLWLVFAAAVIAHLIAQRARLAKLLHVGSHAAAVAVAILHPVWGGVVWGGIHGLEYTFLCARMMKPRDGDADRGIGARWVWPLIGLTILPLLVVGLFNAPFTAWLLGGTRLPIYAVHLTTALVVAHYFADAFIYRFRIPGVRRVALHRLGFS